MISVIIPCYNYGHLIGESIQSVLKQTYKDLEVIVINDGSSDNTEAIVQAIREKDNRVQCHTFLNSGLGASRNRGLEKARGEFIQFLDADDLLQERKFEEEMMLFSANPKFDVVYSSVRYFTNNPHDRAGHLLTYWGPQKEWMAKFSGPGRTFLAQAVKGNFSHLSSALFRRGIIDKVGLFDNEISAVADYHFLLRCVIADAFFYYHDTPETYSLVRWHLDNMSKNTDYMRVEEIKMRKRIAPLLQGNEEAIENNANAIKGISMILRKSWKKVFLSGGRFDFLKKGFRFLGLEKIAIKIFYK
ncbi:MAG: glycosyltransferase [Bacteroidota bacterium]